MKNLENHIDELIGKYLAGEATPDEAADVQEWARKHEANQKYLDHLKLIFDKASTVKAFQPFDTDVAWQKVKTNLTSTPAKTIPLTRHGPDLHFFLKIAASLIVVIGVVLFLYRSLHRGVGTSPGIEVIANENVVSDTLPDGSEVVLNRETRIVYAFDGRKKIHEVKLSGEAYFNIKQEKDERFIIEAQGIFIRDIGTSFNVKAYPGAPVVEVWVEEGEVIFYTEDNPGIHLRAGGRGVYDKQTRNFSIEQPEDNVLAYKNKFFIFSGSDLKTVAEILNGVYKTKLVVAPNLHTCQLSVSFQDESLEEIAEVIAETLNLTARKSDTTIYLEGDGCP